MDESVLKVVVKTAVVVSVFGSLPAWHPLHACLEARQQLCMPPQNYRAFGSRDGGVGFISIRHSN